MSSFYLLLEFEKIFLTHVYDLLEQQDDANNDALGKWVKRDAANATHMKKSETLRLVNMCFRLHLQCVGCIAMRLSRMTLFGFFIEAV